MNFRAFIFYSFCCVVLRLARVAAGKRENKSRTIGKRGERTSAAGVKGVKCVKGVKDSGLVQSRV